MLDSPTAVKRYLINYPQKYKKIHRHKWGKTVTKAAIGVGRRWPSYPTHSPIRMKMGVLSKCCFAVKMLAATTRMIRYNKRTEFSETAYQVKVTTAGMLMCYACYSMTETGSFTIFFYFGIWVPNMIAHKLTNTPVHPVRAV